MACYGINNTSLEQVVDIDLSDQTSCRRLNLLVRSQFRLVQLLQQPHATLNVGHSLHGLLRYQQQKQGQLLQRPHDEDETHISCYAPQTGCTEYEKDQFWETIDRDASCKAKRTAWYGINNKNKANFCSPHEKEPSGTFITWLVTVSTTKTRPTSAEKFRRNLV